MNTNSFSRERTQRVVPWLLSAMGLEHSLANVVQETGILGIKGSDQRFFKKCLDYADHSLFCRMRVNLGLTFINLANPFEKNERLIVR